MQNIVGEVSGSDVGRGALEGALCWRASAISAFGILFRPAPPERETVPRVKGAPGFRPAPRERELKPQRRTRRADVALDELEVHEACDGLEVAAHAEIESKSLKAARHTSASSVAPAAFTVSSIGSTCTARHFQCEFHRVNLHRQALFNVGFTGCKAAPPYLEVVQVGAVVQLVHHHHLVHNDNRRDEGRVSTLGGKDTDGEEAEGEGEEEGEAEAAEEEGEEEGEEGEEEEERGGGGRSGEGHRQHARPCRPPLWPQLRAPCWAYLHHIRTSTVPYSACTESTPRVHPRNITDGGSVRVVGFFSDVHVKAFATRRAVTMP